MMCASDRLIKQRNNFRCSTTAYIQGISPTIRQCSNRLKVVSATFLLVCFVSPKESTFETRKNVSYLTSKALFVLEIIKF